jgi:hypothetical protein
MQISPGAQSQGLGAVPLVPESPVLVVASLVLAVAVAVVVDGVDESAPLELVVVPVRSVVTPVASDAPWGPHPISNTTAPATRRMHDQCIARS